jgi:hypothetical protein
VAHWHPHPLAWLGPCPCHENYLWQEKAPRTPTWPQSHLALTFAMGSAGSRRPGWQRPVNRTCVAQVGPAQDRATQCVITSLHIQRQNCLWQSMANTRPSVHNSLLCQKATVVTASRPAKCPIPPISNSKPGPGALNHRPGCPRAQVPSGRMAR